MRTEGGIAAGRDLLLLHLLSSFPQSHVTTFSARALPPLCTAALHVLTLPLFHASQGMVKSSNFEIVTWVLWPMCPRQMCEHP